MALIAEPLAVFIDGNGEEVEVFNSVDVKEWEAAGFQKAGAKKKGKRGRPKAPPSPKEEPAKTVQSSVQTEKSTNGKSEPVELTE